VNEFRRCRYCGRVVIFDDERHVAAHEGPPCEGWRKLLAKMVEAGLMRELSPELHEVPDDLPAAATAPAVPPGGREEGN
jgi:hypothetical protein